MDSAKAIRTLNEQERRGGRVDSRPTIFISPNETESPAQKCDVPSSSTSALNLSFLPIHPEIEGSFLVSSRKIQFLRSHLSARRSGQATSLSHTESWIISVLPPGLCLSSPLRTLISSEIKYWREKPFPFGLTVSLEPGGSRINKLKVTAAHLRHTTTLPPANHSFLFFSHSF